MLPIQIAVFAFLGLVIIASALGMLLSKNAVYSAVFLVMNFTTVAVLYLTLGAPFIALIQITVYAGAIMVLFLFVIMLLGAEHLDVGEHLRNHWLISIFVAVVLAIEIGLVLVWRGGDMTVLPALTSEFASPQKVGMMLYTEYLLPFMVIGFILLVAAVGAILLTRSEKPASTNTIRPRQE